MARELQGSTKTDYPPMVGLREIGNYVKGTVKATETTKKGNPAVTLSLIDTNGSTTRSTAKGVYEEVNVNEGDDVQVVGSVSDLRTKLPKLAIGDIVTITYIKKIPLDGGKTFKEFKVIVED